METISYQEFLNLLRRKWEPGEHISVIGPTGSGKSWVVADILSLRRFVVVVATKAKDKTLDSRYKGFRKLQKWPPDWDVERALFWKKPKELGDFREQQYAVYSVMNDIYKRGGYTLAFDDLFYLANTLNLKQALQMMYTQVRSNDVSLVGNLQRPRWVPLEAVSQATYIILFRTHDELDLNRVAEGMGINRKTLARANESLQKYEFLFLQIGEEPIKVVKS